MSLPLNVLKGVAAATLGAAAGWIVYSDLFIPHDLPLPPALDAERRTFTGRAGRLSYYVAGQGAPLLLIHSINAAASAYEVRPVFEHYRGQRRVYAVDLPGFGFSDRSARDYTPRLYTDALLDMLDEIGRDTGAGPVDAMSLSLSSEFLARAASERPTRFSSVALVSPTSFSKGQDFYEPLGTARGSRRVRTILEFPVWSRPLFDLLNTRPSARYFLKQTFGSYAAIDQGLLDYDYLSSHQPDAQHAAYAFLSLTIWSADIDRVYESLALPVWLAYGLNDEITRFDDTAAVAAKGNWRIQSFPTGALPHFEQPEQFCAAYDAFLQQTAPLLT